MSVGGLILNALTGGFADKLFAFLNKRADALTDEQRQEATERRQIRENVQAIRMATAGYWEMRVMTFLIAAPFAVHLWAVTLDTVFGFGWRIAKFPPPFDQWEGAILLSFFGVSAAVSSVKAIAGALTIRLPRRGG